MRKSRFTEQQIIGILSEGEAAPRSLALSPLSSPVNHSESALTKKRARKCLRTNTWRIIGLKLPWNQQLQENRGEAPLALHASASAARREPSPKAWNGLALPSISSPDNNARLRPPVAENQKLGRFHDLAPRLSSACSRAAHLMLDNVSFSDIRVQSPDSRRAGKPC